MLRRAIHFASYNFVLNRRSTRTVRADGFRLTADLNSPPFIVIPARNRPNHGLRGSQRTGYPGG